MKKTVVRSPISLDQKHLQLLKELQAKFQIEEDEVISRSEVVRRALRELAKANNVQ
jgi:metal-responsive CopG/Arc/MetJ family transcriptional regulator